MHAETVLLVDHGERKIVEYDLLLEQRMRADQHMNVAGGEPFEHVGALAPAFAAGEDCDVDADRRCERRNRVVVLPRQQLGRRHQRGLAAAFDHGRGRKQRHHRLPRTDVALQQSQHPFGLGEIGDNFGDRARLG